MTSLQSKKCKPCEEGGKPFSPEEIEPFLKQIKAWKLDSYDERISKLYTFVDFKHAVTFVNEVGDLAEFEGHHPDINLHDWNKVTITLSTHAVKGLTENDFIMAAKIDQIIDDSK